MGDGLKSSTIPLLQSPSTGTASKIQTLGNIIVSVVGTGILGLPFAFRIAGWLAGSLGVVAAGMATYYCMLLLVQCKEKLASQELTPETETYGDLGYKCMGNTGRYLTEFLIFISQCGGAVAYLVFIGQNLSSVFKGHGISLASFIFLLVPIEVALSWIHSLSSLAPFSIFADICNVLAMAIVVKEDIDKVISGEFRFGDRTAITSSIGGLPFAGGMAVFCFEGFGMTLSLEASMKEKGGFASLLAKTFSGITLLYVGLCLGLAFTFPIMAHPIHEIVEGKLRKSEWIRKVSYKEGENPTLVGKFGTYLSRAILIVVLALVASFVPGFGEFASLVGSTVCALISFVLPATFHLKLFGSSLRFWQKALDYVFLIGGLLFAAHGFYNSIVGF
uniref:Amino acid transporter transmembrane domain-containing protein n=1 Tax=Salix viminalis TaxID=40686 RepID=A0A6N2N5X5_SALVM